MYSLYLSLHTKNNEGSSTGTVMIKTSNYTWTPFFSCTTANSLHNCTAQLQCGMPESLIVNGEE
jgi:hypothetical protein